MSDDSRIVDASRIMREIAALGEHHFLSITSSIRNPTCNILGIHGGGYEEWRLLGCYAV
jgi:hypothetical protein